MMIIFIVKDFNLGVSCVYGVFCLWMGITPGYGCSKAGLRYPPDKSLSSGEVLTKKNLYPQDSDLSGG